MEQRPERTWSKTSTGPADGIPTLEAFETFSIVFDEALYFIARDSSGKALWKANEDGTATLFKAIYPSELTAGETAFYFTDASLQSNAVWKSDGTLVGTVEISATKMDDINRFPEVRLIADGDTLYALYSYRLHDWLT